MEEVGFNAEEYITPMRAWGRNLRMRIFLMVLYLVFAVGYVLLFTVAVRMSNLISILPLLLAILVFYTWRMVRYEWAVRVERGHVTLAKVRGRHRRTLYEFSLSDVIYAAPMSHRIFPLPRDVSSARMLDARAHPDAPAYGVVVCEQGKNRTVLFPVTYKLVRAMHRYAPVIPVDEEYLNI